jgi:nitric oxide reductase NorD protein
MMWGFLEPEEQLGRYWHSLVHRAESYSHYPDAAVSLDSLRSALAIYFRGVGGMPELEIAAGMPQTSAHRLRLRQRLGLVQERLETAQRDAERILLPPLIDCFPSTSLNRQLYFWLASYLAAAKDLSQSLATDPLQADLRYLHAACHTSRRVCREFPGLRKDYARLCEGLRQVRPQRALPPTERAVEETILALLGAAPPAGQGREFLAAVTRDSPGFGHFAAPRGYRSFLPVPLWGEVTNKLTDKQSPVDDDEKSEGNSGESGDERRRQGQRRNTDQADRDDSFALNRSEKIMSWAEMINVNRPVDDEEEDAAKRAADDMDEIGVGQHKQRAATRLKFDLDLAPRDVDPTRLIAEVSYHEWDYRRACYHPNHCAVTEQTAPDEGERWILDASARQRIRRIQRQFEALRPKQETLRRQLDGSELDLDASVRARCDVAASGTGSDRVYLRVHPQARDLAVAMLVDVSLSTDTWVNNRRVLDVEKEALAAFTFGLEACGDPFAIYTFTSRKRSFVRVETVKTFEEPFGDRVLRRIAALRPGYYTRMGAALRHVKGQLATRPERHRLLLLLTDGKPNDLDHYEGRYGIEDTRKAIREARRAELAVFGITIDRRAQDYFPFLFGRGGYTIISQIEKLPQELPMIYRQLVT